MMITRRTMMILTITRINLMLLTTNTFFNTLNNDVISFCIFFFPISLLFFFFLSFIFFLSFSSFPSVSFLFLFFSCLLFLFLSFSPALAEIWYLAAVYSQRVYIYSTTDAVQVREGQTWSLLPPPPSYTWLRGNGKI